MTASAISATTTLDAANIAAGTYYGNGSLLTGVSTPGSIGWTHSGTYEYLSTTTDYVGIATTTPGYQLQVGNGTITPGGYGSGGSIPVLISNTTSGKYPQLALQGSNTGGAAIEFYGSDGLAKMDFGSNMNTGLLQFINRMNVAGGGTDFRTNGNHTRLFLDNSGNVYLGGDMGDVGGAGSTSSAKLIIQSGGNVGIGTATPDATFNVIGNISARRNRQRHVFRYRYRRGVRWQWRGTERTFPTASSANYATLAGTATNAGYSSVAANATLAATATNALYSNVAAQASSAATASSATLAQTATNAGYSTWSGQATLASTATNAYYSNVAGNATLAATATNAYYSNVAGQATTAASANYATLAQTATNAGYSTWSGQATLASTATNAYYSNVAGQATTAASASFATLAGTATNVAGTGYITAASIVATTTLAAGNIAAGNIFAANLTGITSISAPAIAAGNFYGSGWTHSGTYEYLTNAGDYVGLGTAVPNSPLQVGASTGGNIKVFGNSSDAQIGLYWSTDQRAAIGGNAYASWSSDSNCSGFMAGGGIRLGFGNAPGDYSYLGNRANYTGDLLINPISGKVGIGSCTPDATLTVGNSLSVEGAGNGMFSGTVTAAAFVGNGAGLTNIPSATTANYATLAKTASWAALASSATNAGYSIWAQQASSAAFANLAQTATNAGYSTWSGQATLASTATNAYYSNIAGQASSAASANYATLAQTATNAGYSTWSGQATLASTATNAYTRTLQGMLHLPHQQLSRISLRPRLTQVIQHGQARQLLLQLQRTRTIPMLRGMPLLLQLQPTPTTRMSQVLRPMSRAPAMLQPRPSRQQLLSPRRTSRQAHTTATERTFRRRHDRRPRRIRPEVRRHDERNADEPGECDR